jgi:oligopeptide/dipeptide ABC transporter ATP-binding protein
MPNRNTPILSTTDLSVRFALRKNWLGNSQYLHAVQKVSIQLFEGETLAIVGESGSGKTSFARALIGLNSIWQGELKYAGHAIDPHQNLAFSELRRNVQMVFQDPFGSLDPRLSVQEIIAEPLQIHGTHSKALQKSRVADLLTQVGLPIEAANRYPHQFSGGQRQRVAIARALAPQPKVIIADEPLSALDVSIQSQVMNLMKSLQTTYGLSYILVSHDMAAVHHLADRVAVMYLGRVIESAPVDQLFESPAHPYTLALLQSVPKIGKGKRRVGESLKGDQPSPINPPSGCTFHPRCPMAQERCKVEVPKDSNLSSEHQIACHFPIRTTSALEVTE